MATDWQDRVLTRVRVAKRKQRYRRDAGKAQLNVEVPIEFNKMILAAAREQNISLGGFVRRAIAVAIHAHGGPLRLSLLPLPQRFGQRGGAIPTGPENGVGIGSYCPHPGCEGDHLVYAVE